MNTIGDIIDRLNILAYQEESALYGSYRDRASNCKDESSFRETMGLWAFTVVDHYSLDRELVSIALTNFDRFMALKVKTNMEPSWSTRQLVFATSLNLAIKVHERSPIGMKKFVEFSKNEFSVSEMSKTENEILTTLSWKIHPPTPLSFSSEILRLCVLDLSEISKFLMTKTLEVAIYDATTYLIELSAYKYGVSDKRPSSIALACITNVMEDVISTCQSKFPIALSMDLCQKVEKLTNIKVDYEEVSDLKLRIQKQTNARDDCNEKSTYSVLSPYSDTQKQVPIVSNGHINQQSPRTFSMK